MSGSREVIAAAVQYMERDWRIVAARPDKKPWGDEGDGKNWRRPFSKQEIIDRLQGRLCNSIGFLGGDLNNHIVPLDFDTEDGEAWWQSQCEAAGIPPDDFPTVITPGKVKDGKRTPGRHRYVSDVRGTLGNAEGKLKALGINVRGNGHAMLPPSPHPDGGIYQWFARHSLDDFDVIPACPDFVYAAIEAKRPKVDPQSTTVRPADDGARRYCRAALDNEIVALAQTATSRNNELNNAALKLGSLHHCGAFTEAEVQAALRGACEQNGLIGDDGVRAFEATFQSGWNAGLEKPRTVDPRHEKRRVNGADSDEEIRAAVDGAEPFKPNGAERASILKPRFDLVPFADLQPMGKRAYLVKGLIPRIGLTVIWGPPKSGKSFWAFDLAMHIALGWQYRSRRVIQGPVVYCAFEGAEGYKARAEAFRLRRLAEEASDIPFFLVGAPVDLVADVGDLVGCIRLALAGSMPVAVVLDTLNRSLRGSESKDEDMAAYVRAADAIREAFACAVLVVHHCGIDDKRPRGHTSLTGAADAQLSCKRDGETFTVTVEWLKDGAEGAAVASKLEVVDVGQDEDGDCLTSCIVMAAEGDAPTARAARKLSDRQKLALSALVRIVADRGEPVPAAFSLPAGVMAVPVGFWREELGRCGAIERDAKNPREDFRRLKDALQARSHIAMRDELVWPL